MKRIQGLFSWFANTSLARSLRFRLIGIVLLASLPTIALLFLTANQARNDALHVAQQEANRIATRTASDQAREMDRIQREMTLLGRLPEVRSVDNNECTGLFYSLVSGPNSAIYVDLRVVGLDGRVYCRSSVSNPLGQNEDREFINSAIRQQEFTVGSYRINPLNGRSIISFAAPIHNDDGSVTRAIVATLDLGNQTSALNRATLPEGSLITIVENDGTLLLQHPAESELRIGQSLIGTPAVDRALVKEGAPEDDEDSLDDPDYITGAAEITLTSPQPNGLPAHVLVQIPKAEVVKRAESVFRDNLAKLGVSVSIAILAAWVSADLFMARDSETRKTIVAELYHSYSSGVVDHLDTIVSANVTDHSAYADQAKGLDGIKQSVAAFRHAFPDGEVVPREMIAERDKVIVRVSLTGTQVGEFQGIAPSGKRMIADGIETFTFREGMISEISSLMGPLLEMKQVEQPDLVKVEQKPQKPSLWKRMRGRLRGSRNEEAQP